MTKKKTEVGEAATVITQKIKDLYAEAKKYEAALKALQLVCDHDWVNDGHDSHHNYEKCTRCGVVESD